MLFRSIASISSSTVNLFSRSDLLPRTRRGMPSRVWLLMSEWSSSRACGITSTSAMSTMKTIAFTPRQYLSHMVRNRGCPPKSQHLSVTCPCCTFFMLKPTVGIELHTDRVSQEAHHTRPPHQLMPFETASWNRWGVSASMDHGQKAVRLLDGEFCALSRVLVRMVAGCVQSWGRASYRQHPQQRCLPCILESYHGHVHLGGPVGVGQRFPTTRDGHSEPDQTLVDRAGLAVVRASWCTTPTAYQKVLSNQSYTLRKIPAMVLNDVGRARLCWVVIQQESSWA